MQTTKLLFLLALTTVFISCNENPKANYSNAAAINLEIDSEPHPGKALLESKCYVCHSPSASHDEGRLAPPMVAVKAHYIKEKTTKEEFQTALWNFVEKPDESKAKMRGAIRKFGLMPYQEFSKEEIAQIGEYLFDNEIEGPEWFKEHWENRPKGKGHGQKNRGKKNNMGSGG